MQSSQNRLWTSNAIKRPSMHVLFSLASRFASSSNCVTMMNVDRKVCSKQAFRPCLNWLACIKTRCLMYPWVEDTFSALPSGDMSNIMICWFPRSSIVIWRMWPGCVYGSMFQKYAIVFKRIPRHYHTKHFIHDMLKSSILHISNSPSSSVSNVRLAERVITRLDIRGVRTLYLQTPTLKTLPPSHAPVPQRKLTPKINKTDEVSTSAAIAIAESDILIQVSHTFWG